MPPWNESPRQARWRADTSHYEGLPLAVLAVDAQGTTRYCNAAAERLLDRGRGDIVGAPAEALVPESHRGVVAEVLRRAVGGLPWTGEVPVLVGGSEQLTRLNVTPLWDGTATIGALFVAAHLVEDRTEHLRLHDTGQRLARLARVTAELGRAEDPDEVTEIVIARAADAADATVASLIRLVDEKTLGLVGLRGATSEVADKWATFPLSDPTPVGDAVRSGRPVLVTGLEELRNRYPDLEMVTPGERTLLALPLVAGTTRLGAIALSFPGVRSLDSAEREFLSMLADTCAQALARTVARAEADDRSLKLRFLADASAQLASSLDYEETLRKVARLGVPAFADWCAISLLEDGNLRVLEVVHTDPGKVALARQLEQRYPPSRDARHGSWHVVRTRQVELMPEVADEILVEGAQDAEHLALLRSLDLRSAVIVPLIARDRVLGVMSWLSDSTGRRFSEADIPFVEDVAARAAVAIDNSHLHSETRQTATLLQQAVLPEALAETPGWELHHHYSPSSRTEVGGDFYDAIEVDGRLALLVGDVMGRGVKAAASMAQIRAAVRAYIAVDPAPSAVLGHLDEMFARYDVGQLVTLVYVLADPARDELLLGNAGHPPPYLLGGDGVIGCVVDGLGPPLGLGGVTRTEVRVPFRPGGTLLLYTDGLVERRDEDIDVGLARLTAAMPLLERSDLERGLSKVVTTVRDHSREDDVAALVAHRLPGRG